MRSLSMFFPLSNSMLGTQDGAPQFPSALATLRHGTTFHDYIIVRWDGRRRAAYRSDLRRFPFGFGFRGWSRALAPATVLLRGAPCHLSPRPLFRASSWKTPWGPFSHQINPEQTSFVPTLSARAALPSRNPEPAKPRQVLAASLRLNCRSSLSALS